MVRRQAAQAQQLMLQARQRLLHVQPVQIHLERTQCDADVEEQQNAQDDNLISQGATTTSKACHKSCSARQHASHSGGWY